MSQERIRLNIENGVAIATLDRADKFNALDFAMFDAITAVTQQIAADNSVRAVVLQAAGDHFCSGIDIGNFSADNLSGDAERMQPVAPSSANYYQSAATAWRELPVPVIAALQGSVFGGGLQVAMGADVRIATPTANFSVMEIKWGIVPDMGFTTTMRDVIRADVLREWVYTGQIAGAAQALQDGFITRIDESPGERAAELAKQIAERSPDAVRAAKRLLNASQAISPADALLLEAKTQLGLLGGANQREAVMANVEKRRPNFRDSE